MIQKHHKVISLKCTTNASQKIADISNAVHLASLSRGRKFSFCGTIRLAKFTLIGCDEWERICPFWKQSIYERVFLHQEAGVFDCGLEAFFSEIQDSLRDERESGSGKTTFLHLLAGILKPDEGSDHSGREGSFRNERGSKRPLASRIDWLCFSIIQPAPRFHLFGNVLLAASFAGR